MQQLFETEEIKKVKKVSIFECWKMMKCVLFFARNLRRATNILHVAAILVADYHILKKKTLENEKMFKIKLSHLTLS